MEKKSKKKGTNSLSKGKICNINLFFKSDCFI